MCLECNCHGHSTECVYNATVDAMKLSLNTAGEYDGGGVCIDCKVRRIREKLKVRRIWWERWRYGEYDGGGVCIDCKLRRIWWERFRYRALCLGEYDLKDVSRELNTYSKKNMIGKVKVRRIWWRRVYIEFR